jgi:hypothetical protein
MRSDAKRFDPNLVPSQDIGFVPDLAPPLLEIYPTNTKLIFESLILIGNIFVVYTSSTASRSPE